MSLVKKLALAGAIGLSSLVPNNLEARGETLPYQNLFREVPERIEINDEGEEEIKEAYTVNTPRLMNGTADRYIITMQLPLKPETGCIKYHIQTSLDGVNYTDFDWMCTSSPGYDKRPQAGVIPIKDLVNVYARFDEEGNKILPEIVFTRVLINDCKEHSGSRGTGR